MEITAVLRNWAKHHFQGFDYIAGEVYDDTKGRFPDGSCIRTSYLTKIRDEGDHYIFVTKNSVYRANKEEQTGKTDDRNLVTRSRSLEGS